MFENTTLRLLELFRQNYMTELTLGEEELYSFFSIMVFVCYLMSSNVIPSTSQIMAWRAYSPFLACWK